MKRNDFIKLLEQRNIAFLRHGSRHDIYQNSKTGKKVTIPRHGEIDNDLVKKILAQIEQR